jgi:hypothetical protein
MNEPVLTSDDPFEGMTRKPHPVEALHHIETLARSAQDITDMDTAQKHFEMILTLVDKALPRGRHG